ncbi:hypothetical protein PLGE761_22970 [Pluralibacter gergoviae]
MIHRNGIPAGKVSAHFTNKRLVIARRETERRQGTNQQHGDQTSGELPTLNGHRHRPEQR